MKCICPHCSEEINLSIFLNREVKKKEDPENETLKAIAEIVCTNTGITLEDFRQTRQTRVLVRPRQQFMWLAKNYTDVTLLEIGRFIRPDMDHTTVIHGIRTIKNLADTSRQEAMELQFLIDRVEEKLLLKQLEKAG